MTWTEVDVHGLFLNAAGHVVTFVMVLAVALIGFALLADLRR